MNDERMKPDAQLNCEPTYSNREAHQAYVDLQREVEQLRRDYARLEQLSNRLARLFDDNEKQDMFEGVVIGYANAITYIADLQRMIYECVSLRDVIESGLSEDIYNDVVLKYERDNG